VERGNENGKTSSVVRTRAGERRVKEGSDEEKKMTKHEEGRLF